MRILFAGNKERGAACLRGILQAGHAVLGVIAHPPSGDLYTDDAFLDAAKDAGAPLFRPADINAPEFLEIIRPLAPDVIVLAGY